MDQHPALVAKVEVRDDFAGLVVGIDRAAPAPLASSSPITSEIPLTFTYLERPEAAVSRWDDETPFWGGDAMERPDKPGYVVRCSGAFGAHTSSGQNVMVTSYHCGSNKDWTTPTGWRYGRSNGGSSGLDSMLVSGGSYDDAMYVGDYQSNQGVPVYGAGDPALGSWVFASGSHSGASVIQVSGVNSYINLEGVGRVGPGFSTQNTDHVASVGQGDSGGPVAQAVSVTGGTAIYARGVITGGTPETAGTCQGYSPSTRTCWWETFHVNIGSIMSHWGLTIGNTGGA